MKKNVFLPLQVTITELEDIVETEMPSEPQPDEKPATQTYIIEADLDHEPDFDN
jgi:hypothetical protein